MAEAAGTWGGALVLGKLPREPWGRRLQRARESAGLSLIPLAGLVHASKSTLARLEQQHEAPRDAARRQLAALVCVAAGVEPTDVDLAWSDVPAGVDLAGLQADARAAAVRYARVRTNYGCSHQLPFQPIPLRRIRSTVPLAAC